ncbi:hypothetical protein HPB50_017280 [Hyalomma asiaticum]|uniref:Uncharacterized protein n=1 Tax=Hyalomma asiaticum TaxID=266040 RepID=A0ACB7SWU6_HYAAI|nr:hypothetical protein HPB50_017280 [Hyalomma asiaticum]
MRSCNDLFLALTHGTLCAVVSEATRTERSFRSSAEERRESWASAPPPPGSASLVTGVGGSSGEPPSRPSAYWDDPHFRPRFDNSTERNVTAQLGKSAFLHCKIRQLGDRTVAALNGREYFRLRKSLASSFDSRPSGPQNVSNVVMDDLEASSSAPLPEQMDYKILGTSGHHQMH